MLNGYKTKLGASGLVLAGLARIVTALSLDPIDQSAFIDGAGMVAAGLAAFGIRSKLG